MPEGDTIFRAARTLHRALAGHTVTRFETGLAQLAHIDREEPLTGRTVERVEAAGKNVLMTFSGGLVLRSHMRMNGSWHIYRRGEKWQMPAHAMRILIETAGWTVVGFRVYVAEFVRADRLARYRPVATLGPDLLGAFDQEGALALVRQQGAAPVHAVLLDQRVVAGIGNVYKSETLFLAGIHPDRPASSVDDERWRAVFAIARRLLKANITHTSGNRPVTYTGLRRTTGRMNPADRLWVYGRRGRPCRRCGTPITSRKDGDAARPTYWCPSCQKS